METRDSGKRQEYPTGAVRDTEDGKLRIDLIPYMRLAHLQFRCGGPPPAAIETIRQRGVYDISHPEESEMRHDLIPQEALDRWAALMYRGAEKYDDRNWEKGIPLDRMYASAMRHMVQWANGATDEDHLAAALFNIGGIIFFENRWLDDAYSSTMTTAGPLSYHSKVIRNEVAT